MGYNTHQVQYLNLYGLNGDKKELVRAQVSSFLHEMEQHPLCLGARFGFLPGCSFEGALIYWTNTTPKEDFVQTELFLYRLLSDLKVMPG